MRALGWLQLLPQESSQAQMVERPVYLLSQACFSTAQGSALLLERQRWECLPKAGATSRWGIHFLWGPGLGRSGYGQCREVGAKPRREATSLDQPFPPLVFFTWVSTTQTLNVRPMAIHTRTHISPLPSIMQVWQTMPFVTPY